MGCLDHLQFDAGDLPELVPVTTSNIRWTNPGTGTSCASSRRTSSPTITRLPPPSKTRTRGAAVGRGTVMLRRPASPLHNGHVSRMKVPGVTGVVLPTLTSCRQV
jgi:hypothetical protein